MRLIDADKIEFHGLNNRVCPDLSAQDVIDEQPTIDAVPVVRCRECVYKNTTACPAYDAPFMRTSLRIKFCSEGQRREDEHEQ